MGLRACVGWFVYVTALSTTGVLDDFSLPPRAGLLIVLPAIVSIVVVTGRPSFQPLLRNIPCYLPIFLQSFRIIVELLIYGAYQNGVFPQRATFEGINFDILVGISALPMGWLVFKKMIAPRGILIWNVVSLMVLTVTAFSFIYTYYLTDYLTTGGTLDFVHFPYILLASVLLPTAIFLHVFSIRQVGLLSKRDQ